MVFSSSVVIRGFLGTNPKTFGSNGTEGISFRLACSRSYFDRKNQQWKDAPTTWITVRAFRGLAQNILNSVVKGDPVVVAGELVTDEWMQDGARRSSVALQASVVGHDLNQGSSNFRRLRVNQSANQQSQQNSQQPVGQPSSTTPQTALQTGAAENRGENISGISESTTTSEFSGFADEPFANPGETSEVTTTKSSDETAEKREPALV